MYVENQKPRSENAVFAMFIKAELPVAGYTAVHSPNCTPHTAQGSAVEHNSSTRKASQADLLDQSVEMLASKGKAPSKRRGTSRLASKTNMSSTRQQTTTGPSFTLNSIPGKTTAEKRRVSLMYTGQTNTASAVLSIDGCQSFLSVWDVWYYCCGLCGERGGVRRSGVAGVGFSCGGTVTFCGGYSCVAVYSSSICMYRADSLMTAAGIAELLNCCCCCCCIVRGVNVVLFVVCL